MNIIILVIIMPNRKKQKKNNSCQTNDDDNDDNNNDIDEIEREKRFLSDIIKIIGNEDQFNDNLFEHSESDNNLSDTDDESTWPLIEINEEIKTLDDLINLGKRFDINKKERYNVDLKTLSKLITPLNKLKNMIGLEDVKKSIVGHITYFLAKLDESHNDMMHTVITGPPGVGKTELGKILGEIYFNMGILEGNKNKKRSRSRFTTQTEKYTFKIVKRSDLIGKYLGHTASKTQEVIDSCEGGVLFIDEAYSLGNAEGRDSFSKECIDTINQNLTEKKKNLLVIIAGYKESLESCFFAYNEGLSRRFTFRYNIEKYSGDELKDIFFKMVTNLGWEVKLDDIESKFFKDNYDSFKNMAGDIETLLFNCKIAHGKRVFCKPKEKKKITLQDIKEGFKMFKDGRGTQERKTYLDHLYI